MSTKIKPRTKSQLLVVNFFLFNLNKDNSNFLNCRMNLIYHKNNNNKKYMIMKTRFKNNKNKFRLSKTNIIIKLIELNPFSKD